MRPSTLSTFADTALPALALLWAGVLIGVSFIATPVKFSAPGLSLPVALEVGHVTFRLFSRIEWVLAAGLIVMSLPGRSRFRAACALLLGAVVAVQALWLLPALDARIAAVVAGTPLPPSSYHTLYAVAEAGKLLLLAALGFTGLKPLFHRQSRQATSAKGN